MTILDLDIMVSIATHPFPNTKRKLNFVAPGLKLIRILQLLYNIRTELDFFDNEPTVKKKKLTG